MSKLDDVIDVVGAILDHLLNSDTAENDNEVGDNHSHKTFEDCDRRGLEELSETLEALKNG